MKIIRKSIYSELCNICWGKFGVFIYEISTNVTLIGVGIVYTV